MKRLFASLFLVGVMVVMPVTARAVTMDNFKLHGFFDLEYEKADGPGNSDPAKASGDEKGSFDQYHFNLLMEFPVSDKLTVKGHIEYEHGPQLPSKGEMKIEWSYLEYLLSNTMKLRGGIVLTPFGIYNEIHDATPTYVSTRVPWGIYKADKLGGFAMFPKFSTGINLLGNYESEGDLSLNYVVYIANGENTSKNEAERDDNENKAVGGRVMVSPMPGLTVGGSYFTGKIGTAKLDHSAWAGTVSYRRSPISLRAEYASSEKDNVTETGWYGEIAYRINVITPFVRYGTLDPNDDTDNDEWRELVYGINYEIEPNLILKLENRQFGGEASNSKVSEDYNEIGASVTVAF